MSPDGDEPDYPRRRDADLERRRWSDERIEDRFRAIERAQESLEHQMRALGDTGGRILRLEPKVEGVREDTQEAKAALAKIVEQMEADRRAREAELLKAEERRVADMKAAAEEKKKDRRWLVGTLLTAAMLIIAAVGLLTQLLG